MEGCQAGEKQNHKEWCFNSVAEYQMVCIVKIRNERLLQKPKLNNMHKGLHYCAIL